MKRFRRRDAGDTIVEVLIAIVIVATVLGGAYATANRSLLATRESQERGEALNLAEGQLEALRGLALQSTLANPGAIFTTQQDIFCIVTIGTAPSPVNAVEDASLQPYALGHLPSATSDTDANYTRVNPSKPPCAINLQGSSYYYDIAIDRCDNSDNATPDCAPYYASPYTGEPQNSALFIVHVRWDSSSSSVRNEVILQYRLYEGNT